MSQFLNSFFGDRPVRTLIKLLIFSLFVGWLLANMGWKPLDVPKKLWQLVVDIAQWGIYSFSDFFDTLLVGAMIVIPFFIIRRLLGGRKQ